MLSSFKGIEARRETAMRHIEESSKQKLIEVSRGPQVSFCVVQDAWGREAARRPCAC
jgi:hypothetical protein